MARKANPLIVGSFVLGALILIGTALFFIGGTRVFTQREKFICYFEESVNGLILGAPVKYRGVSVGKVKAIRLRFNQEPTSTHIPIIIEIDTKLLKQLVSSVDLKEKNTFQRLIKDYGLRAQLQYESLVSGYLFIALDYHTPSPEYQAVQKKPIVYNEIPTIPSEIQEFSTDLLKIASNLSKVDFKSIENEVKTFLVDVNPPLIKALSDFNELVVKLEDEVKPLSEEAQKTAADLRKSLEQFGDVLTAAQKLLEPGSTERYHIDNAFSELTAAAKALNRLADFLERNPNAILIGKPRP